MFGNYFQKNIKNLNLFLNQNKQNLLINLIIKRNFANHRHKKMIKLAKGYFGRVNLYAVAKRRVEKARMYAYRDRRV